MAMLTLLPSSPNSLFLLLSSYAFYFILRGIYRIFFHPLSTFPGPKLAAWTHWYEVYYEVWRDGKFSAHIDELHKRYGPIIRVNPHELHINDPAFYDQLYNFSPDIDRPTLNIHNLEHTPTHALHRRRRRALDPYFTKPAVQALTPVMTTAVEDLSTHFHTARTTNSPLSISLLARCFTIDVVTEYIFAQPCNFLKDPEGSKDFFMANDSVFKAGWMIGRSKLARFVFMMIIVPLSLMPGKGVWKSFGMFISTVQARLKVLAEGKTGDDAKGGHRVMFQDWAKLDIPEADKTGATQLDNALLFTGAGFETTAYTTELAVFHVLDNPKILAKLNEELVSAIPDSNDIPEWTALEKLPYLHAVIQESLRLSLGVLARLSRKNMKSPMEYQGWVIPKGQLVGMSSRNIHYNKDIYPEPWNFDPERWLKGQESKDLEKYLVSFSRGSRRCIGMHLAYAELYTVLATIFRSFKLELFETTRMDVDPAVDYFIPKPEHGGNGVRVLVR